VEAAYTSASSTPGRLRTSASASSTPRRSAASVSIAEASAYPAPRATGYCLSAHPGMPSSRMTALRYPARYRILKAPRASSWGQLQ